MRTKRQLKTTTSNTTTTKSSEPTIQTERQTSLRRWLKQQRRILIALSGGVDSSLLAAIAQQELPTDVLAVTGVSASVPSSELDSIKLFCQTWHIPYQTVATDELALPAYRANAVDRCFHCKTELYEKLTTIAAETGITTIVDGTHTDDLHGHRPGREAAFKAGIVSPFIDFGFDKNAIRAWADELGLSNAQRPSSPCLSSRVAYGLEVTSERLSQVEHAEALLFSLGFSRARVRHHGPIARIEVPLEDLPRLIEHAPAVRTQLKHLGFVYVTLDLGGLRSGSLLEVFQPHEVAS